MAEHQFIVNARAAGIDFAAKEGKADPDAYGEIAAQAARQAIATADDEIGDMEDEIAAAAAAAAAGATDEQINATKEALAAPVTFTLNYTRSADRNDWKLTSNEIPDNHEVKIVLVELIDPSKMQKNGDGWQTIIDNLTAVSFQNHTIEVKEKPGELRGPDPTKPKNGTLIITATKNAAGGARRRRSSGRKTRRSRRRSSGRKGRRSKRRSSGRRSRRSKRRSSGKKRRHRKGSCANKRKSRSCRRSKRCTWAKGRKGSMGHCRRSKNRR